MLVDWRIQTLHLGQCSFPIKYTEDMLPRILSCFPDHVIAKQWDTVKEIRKPSMRWDMIQGWHDETNERIYRELVDRIPNGGRFLEVGCWLGRSTACFGLLAQQAQKEIEINVVDTFTGTETEPCKSLHAPVLEAHGGNLRKVFTANMRACGVPARIFEGKSVDAASQFPDGSLDAVYLDGDHSSCGMWDDLKAWVPKVKPGGVICGDDYGVDFPGVTEAVQSYFAKDRIRQEGRVWIVEVV